MAMTIHDIARMAGVSIATVSKVLNGYPDIGEKTRAKVIRIMREAGYQPNAVARGLAMKRSWLIGVFFQDAINTGLNHPFFLPVIHGCKLAVGAAGYDLLFFSDTGFGGGRSNYMERARHRGVDGVLVMGVHRHDEGLQALIAGDLPTMFVDIDGVGPRAGYVHSNNRKGAADAILYLYQLGHRKFAMINDLYGTFPGEERRAGVIEQMESLGLPVSDALFEQGDFTRESGRDAVQRLWARGERPTAVFAFGDMMALGVIDGLREMGLSVPGDVSVIGFDDIQAAAQSTPPLTTIRQEMYRIGEHAGEALVAMMEKDAPPAVVEEETALIVRDSCAAVPVADS